MGMPQVHIIPPLPRKAAESWRSALQRGIRAFKQAPARVFLISSSEIKRLSGATKNINRRAVLPRGML